MSAVEIGSIGSLYKTREGQGVLCLDTGETFDGVVDAAKSLGVTPTFMRRAIRQCFKVDGRIYLFSDEPVPPYITGDPADEVTCLETGLVYPSIEAAARAFKMPAASIGLAMDKGGTAAGYHWFVTEKGKSSVAGYHSKGKAVVCRETGEVYPTIKDAADAVRLMNPDCLTNAIRRNGRSAGYHWRFATDDEVYNLRMYDCRSTVPEEVDDPTPDHSRKNWMPLA